MTQFQTVKSTEKFIKDNNIQRFKIGVVDFNGILRGKYVSKSKFVAGLKSGLSFCDVIIGCDVNDDLVENMDFTGWDTGYPDAPLKIIYQTGKVLPYEPSTMFFLCEFYEEAEAICPRSLLRRCETRRDEVEVE